MLGTAMIKTAALLLAASASVLAAPARPVITHLGSQGPILCRSTLHTTRPPTVRAKSLNMIPAGGVMTRDLVYTSGTTPSINGTIPEGISAQTVSLQTSLLPHSLLRPPKAWSEKSLTPVAFHPPQKANVINNIAAVLKEAGTSWEYALKTTVFLANMDDYAAMNAVYGELLPNPKPARTTIQAGKLPGNFLVEIEAVVARPHC